MKYTQEFSFILFIVSILRHAVDFHFFSSALPLLLSFPFDLLVGKPEGKRPLGRPRRRWIDNIKMDLLGVNVVDWIDLAQDRYRWRTLVNSVMNLRVPQNAGNYRVAAQVVASRLVLSSTELVS
jgi:hypothetical protein